METKKKRKSSRKGQLRGTLVRCVADFYDENFYFQFLQFQVGIN